MKYFLALVLLAFASVAHAGTYSPSTCSYADVNAAINNTTPGTGGSPQHLAVNGDVILIPSGSCTWTSSLAVSVNITIQGNGTQNSLPTQYGAGTTNTVITYNFTSTSLIVATVPYVSGTPSCVPASTNCIRISTLDIEPGAAMVTPGQIVLSVVGTCTTSGCPSARIDNIYFGKTSPFNAAATDRPLIAVDNVFGVADHNQTNPATNPHFIDVEYPAWQGVGAFGDNSWAQPDTFGSLSQFYTENNLVNFILAYSDTELAAQGTGGGIGGARSTHRFNHINIPNNLQPSGVFGGHGLDTDGRPQGIRHVEAYGNTISNTSGFSAGGAVDIRGGTAIVFGNTMTVSGSGSVFKSGITAAVYRNVYWDPDGWAACGGLSPYDTNDTNGVFGNTAFVYYSGTISTASSGSLTMTDATKTWTANQFVPSGAPYSVYDVTQGTGFVAEIVSNTTDTITIQPPISESCWYSGHAGGSTACGGTGSATGGFNNGDSYEIVRSTVCADQFGRGIGALVSANPPVPAAIMAQAPDPAYELDDVYSPGFTGSGGANFSPSTTKRFLLNRDVFSDISNGSPTAQTSSTSPFDGTGASNIGVGFGTLANRPACTSGCLVGVGYLATDQGSWNSSANTYAGGYTQGQFYKFTPTLNVDVVYKGNASTVGTALTGAIGDASIVSNNCVPTTCAQWKTPGGSGANYFVGANQSACNNMWPVTVNGGGPTYAAGALNFNNIQYTNTLTLQYWELYLSTIPSSTNNLTFGTCVANLPAIGTQTIDMWFLQDTFGNKAWAQAHKCANGNYGFGIESSVLTSGGSDVPCIDVGSSTAYPSSLLISENYNESTAGLGAYGTYASGGTATGTIGQTCSVSATGSVYGFTTLQGTNSLTGATVYLIATPGTPFASAPTSATLSNGAANANPATCSGTITISGATLGGVATISIHNGVTGVLIGQEQVAVGYHSSPQLADLQIGQGENYTGATSWQYQNGMLTYNSAPLDMFAQPTTGTWQLAYTPGPYPHPFISSTPQAGTPTFSPVAGSYPATTTVSITSSPSTVICWNTTGAPATNGSSGCTTGTLYTGPIPVSSSETVYAVGGGTGYFDSFVGSASYTIGANPAAGVMTSGTRLAGGTTIR